MLTIKNETQYELIINKSIFISKLAPVNSIEEAKDFIEKIKEEYPDANHHVSAYRIGDGAEFGHYSDDGEPSGTAGLPVFEVLRKNDLTNIVCVVTRYFGGIKLGAGGLVRAYGKSVSENLQTQEILPIIKYQKLLLSFHYSYINEIDLMLKDYEIIRKDFTDKVSYIIRTPEKSVSNITEKLIELTSGNIEIKIL